MIRKGRNFISLAAMLSGVLWIGEPQTTAAFEAPPSKAAMSPYRALVVFGDSLSDSGNNGRYTNGPVWVELVARRLGLPLTPSRSGGTNYAVGGAPTHGNPTAIRAQVQSFLSQHRGEADSEALYVLFGGANDLLGGGCQPGDRTRVAQTAAAALRATVDDLTDAGATHILVANMPDIGLAPILRVQGPECAAAARRLTVAFNDALDQELRTVEDKSRIRILRLDTYGLAERLKADPQAAGFTDISSPCMNGPCDGALFWDPVHPTSAAHARLADAALAVIDGWDR